MKKHTLLVILVLVLGTLKSVTAENVDNITFSLHTPQYLHLYNNTINGALYSESMYYYPNGSPCPAVTLEITHNLQNYSGPEPYAGAEWTFPLPKNCTEITGIKIHLVANHNGGLPLEIYLNNIPIYNITQNNFLYDANPPKYCFYIGNVHADITDCDYFHELDESVLEKINEKIKNAKTLTLRLEMKGNMESYAFIFCDKSYIYVEYRPGSTAPVSKAPVPTSAVVFGALIITALLLRRA